MNLTMSKSKETYEEYGTELSYWNIMCGNDVIGKMKADYKSKTQRSWSGQSTFSGVSSVVSDKKSLTSVLLSIQEELESGGAFASMTSEVLGKVTDNA